MDSEFNYIKQDTLVGKYPFRYLDLNGRWSCGYATREQCAAEFELYKSDYLNAYNAITDGINGLDDDDDDDY